MPCFDLARVLGKKTLAEPTDIHAAGRLSQRCGAWGLGRPRGSHVAAAWFTSNFVIAGFKSALQVEVHVHNSPAAPTLDANGRFCLMCDLPPAERAPNKSYVQRTDCGNHSVFKDAAMLHVPLSTFQKNATEEHNQTFGWCELHVQKSCADAICNQDYMLFAKSIMLRELPPLHSGAISWDQYFCFYNGWLSPEIKALQHNFQGMSAKGRDFCNSEDLIKRGSRAT